MTAARVLLALGVIVHVGSVAGLVVALLVGGGWRPIGSAVVGIVAGAVWVMALHDVITDQQAREQLIQPTLLQRAA